MKVKYQAVVKWHIDSRKSKQETGWMYCDGPNDYYNNYEECLEAVKKEIKRRSKTEQAITRYKIYKVIKEVVEEQAV